MYPPFCIFTIESSVPITIIICEFDSASDCLTFLLKVNCWLVNNLLLLINKWGKSNLIGLQSKEFTKVSFYPIFLLQNSKRSLVLAKTADNFSLYQLFIDSKNSRLPPVRTENQNWWKVCSVFMSTIYSKHK